MDNDSIPLRLRVGDPVRIEGRAFTAGPVTDGGRVFTEKSTGQQLVLPTQAQLRMALELRITSEATYRAISPSKKEALTLDWDAFTPAERLSAELKYPYVKAVDETILRDRFKTKAVHAAIEKVVSEHPEEKRKTPRARRVKEWYRAYVAAGRDIRALVDAHFKRGRRDPRHSSWVCEEAEKAINEVYAQETRGSIAETRRRAITRICARAEREGLTVPDLGQRGDVIGKNFIRKLIAKREQFDLLAKRFGRAEAERKMARVGVGPQAEYPLGEVEVDHTSLDVMVIDPKTRQTLGRPWLTVLLDRYSRAILGFSLSFHPPSWPSVMEALRISVMPKTEILSELGGITSSWDCFGTPDTLFCDNGKEFHSTSMQATEAALGMKIIYLPRRKPWLKGKVERWFSTLEEQVVHRVPGTTFSNVIERGVYASEKLAVMTIDQLKWVVTKWTVDIYQQDIHSATGESPADRWRRGIELCGQKLPPPKELIVPLVGMVVPRSLSREGVRFKGLRWNSNEFSALRNRMGEASDRKGGASEVLIRIDPMDLSVAYAFDEKSRRWIPGHLQAEDDVVKLTLHQYEVIRAHAEKTRQPDENKMNALARARGEVFEFVKTIIEENNKSKAPKRFARFKYDGRKPSEHIASSRKDPAESAKPIGSHSLRASSRHKREAPPAIAPMETTDAVEPDPSAPPAARRTFTIRSRGAS